MWLIGRWYVCVLHRWSNCPLSRVVDGRIMRHGWHGIISSCQSAAASETVQCCWSWVYSCKQPYSKYPDLYVYLYLADKGLHTFQGPSPSPLPSLLPPPIHFPLLSDDVIAAKSTAGFPRKRQLNFYPTVKYSGRMQHWSSGVPGRESEG